MEHFGITLKKSKYGFSLTRDNYIHPSKKSSFNSEDYDDRYISFQTRRALFNFDLNMKFFSSLDKIEFEDSLQKFLKTYPQFLEVKDLKKYDLTSGYYMLILDKYKQIYIGSTNNIRRRICQHWTNQKQFDRLIFGSIFTSRLSIDSFRPLDTTKIYVYPTRDIFKDENNFILKFPDKFIINRTKGGILDNGLKDAVSKRKTRNLDLKI